MKELPPGEEALDASKQTREALAGTALVQEKQVSHDVFFRLDGPERPEGMATFRSRRRRFTE